MRPGRSLIARVFTFNQHDRDQWVARQAALVRPGADVLDVGAGSCPYRSLFAHCNYKTHDSSLLEADQLRDLAGYGQIDYVSDVASIPIPDGSFDVVLCTEVLEHVPEPIQGLREFARILRPGGTLLLTAPLGSGLHQEPYHFYGGYTPYWYQRFLGDNGFVQITVEPNGGFFKFYGQESQRFSVLLQPRRFRGLTRLVVVPIWAATLPWFRLVMPALGYLLDPLDRDHRFTVGYHVTAVRQ